MANDERLRELEERYEGYTVYDNTGSRIGKVDDLFVDETDREEYIGVKMGLFGLSGTTLIPMEIVRVNDQERTIEVSESKDRVKDAPHFSDDDDVTPDFEERIRRHFGLESLESSTDRGSYGRYSGDVGTATAGPAAGGSRTGDNPLREDRAETEQHSGGPRGGAQDPEIYDESEREPLGQEGYRNREDMGSEPAAGVGGATPSGGMRDLDTGEPGRATGRVEDEDADSMTRGHREEAGREGIDDREEAGRDVPGARQGSMSSGSAAGGTAGVTPADERGGADEGYREGYREGLREGLRDSGDLGSSGTSMGSGTPEEGMNRGGGTGEPGSEDLGGRVGPEGRAEGGGTTRSGDGDRETSRREAEQEESGLTRVWRRVRS
jgi:sporulation protein YlmC with PRC-barrel domain